MFIVFICRIEVLNKRIFPMNEQTLTAIIGIPLVVIGFWIIRLMIKHDTNKIFDSGEPVYKHTEEGINGIGERKDNDGVEEKWINGFCF